jgi:hypothetical protein
MFTDLLPASISGFYQLLFLIGQKISLHILTEEQTEVAATTVESKGFAGVHFK